MDKKKVRVGSVSYLNSKPLIYGFEQGLMKDDLELFIDYPSAIARLLIEDKIDIGLVPVAIIPFLKEHYIVSDYCIGCDGEVATVCLFSDVPVDEIKTILLDYQSRTSVALLKLLLKDHWKLSPELVDAKEDYEKRINGTTAGLVIGDRAFVQRTRSPYVYDLGKAWKDMTGMPFVFAAWVSNKQLSPLFLEKFNNANNYSLANLDEILLAYPSTNFDLKQYFTTYIKYDLDEMKRDALQYFLSKI